VIGPDDKRTYEEQPKVILCLLCSQAGQSMAEFLVIVFVAMFLIFGAIQFALIFHAKITLNYAAFEAARYGSLENANFSAVKEGFIRGLAPLYSYYNTGKDNTGVKGTASSQVQAFQEARYKLSDEFEDSRNLIRIERISPGEQAFTDYAADDSIPNDNLIYRASKAGKVSGVTIQDANLLHLKITYWYPLYVPLVNKAIFKTVCSMEKWQNELICRQDKTDPEDPRIPLTSVAVTRMQSPARKSDGFQ